MSTSRMVFQLHLHSLPCALAALCLCCKAHCVGGAGTGNAMRRAQQLQLQEVMDQNSPDKLSTSVLDAHNQT